MPLPDTFPIAPKRPPAGQPLLTQDGTMTKPWLAYFDALDRFNTALRNRLDGL